MFFEISFYKTQQPVLERQPVYVKKQNMRKKCPVHITAKMLFST